MERTYAEYAARQAMELLAIDSPTGFTARAADWVQRAFEELGYTARRTAKGRRAGGSGRSGARACCWRLTPTRWAAWWQR